MKPNYADKNAASPIITWDFINGLIPADGFYWLSSETRDGLHANDQDYTGNTFSKLFCRQINMQIFGMRPISLRIKTNI